MIKVSPGYYRYQDVSQLKPQGSKHILKVHISKDDPGFLIKMDKAIVDKICGLSVPEIKFSGVLFSVLFGSALVALAAKAFSPVYNNRPFPINNICIAQCPLRL
jgi:hypothetical protein